MRLGLGLGLARSTGGGGVPAALRSQFGLNLGNAAPSDYFSTIRNYNNLAVYDQWRKPDSSIPAAANVDANGNILSVDGGSAYYAKTMGFPRVSGSRVRITWTGAGAITLSGSGYSNVDTSTPNVIEYDHTFNPERLTPLMFLRATGAVSNLDAREVGASSSRFDSSWVNSLKKYRVIRFMDFQGMNSTWLGSSAADLTHPWANRATGPQSMLSSSTRATRTVGTGNAALTFTAKNYISSSTKLAAELPNHWFGPNGNNIEVEILPASGAGSVTVTNLKISVVPAVAATTSAQVRIQIYSNLDAFALVDVTAGGDGTGTVGTASLANLSGGSFGFKREGMPIEHIVELANLSGCRPWICIPANADDDYVTQISAYAEANLNAACRPIIWELCNELWNDGPGFQAGQLYDAKAIKEGLTPATRVRKQANRHVEVMNLISAQMDSADIIRTLGAQAASTTAVTAQLGYAGVLAATDAVAIAPYYYDTGTDVETTFANMASNINAAIAGAVAHKTVTDANGINLIFYEGGQHLSSGDLTHMQGIMRDDRMKFFYGQYFSELARLFPDTDFAHYAESSVIASVGAWGLTEYMGQTGAPKYDAYIAAIAGNFPAYYATAPAITGVRSVGQTLTVSQPTAYNATTITRQWLRDGVAISGETGTTYLQVLADDTKVIECQVTLTGNAAYDPTVYTTPGGAPTSTVFDPASLFTGGEYGFVIDPSNLGSLWENAGGTGAVVVGDPVGQANDLSGGNRHLTNSTSDQRPLLQLDGAGYYLSFDGANDHLDYLGAGLYSAGAATIIIGLRGAAQTDKAIFAEGSSISNNPWYFLRSGTTSNDDVFVSQRNDATTITLQETSGSKIVDLLDSTNTVLTFDDSGTTARLRENGGSWQSQAYTRGTTTMNRTSLGSLLRATPNLYFAGRIYGLIAINRQLTGPELADAEAWVTDRLP